MDENTKLQSKPLRNAVRKRVRFFELKKFEEKRKTAWVKLDSRFPPEFRAKLRGGWTRGCVLPRGRGAKLLRGLLEVLQSPPLLVWCWALWHGWPWHEWRVLARLTGLPLALLLLLSFSDLTHRYNAVRGHRTDSNSGVENYLRRKNKWNQKIIHAMTEPNGIPQTKRKRWDQRTYVSRYIYIYIIRVC